MMQLIAEEARQRQARPRVGERNGRAGAGALGASVAFDAHFIQGVINA